MKFNNTNNNQRRLINRASVAAAIIFAMASQLSSNVAEANAAFGANTDITGAAINVPTYFASSPSGIHPAYDLVTHAYSTTGVTVDTGVPLRKFVDPLGGAANGLDNLPGATDLQSGIPVAITDKWVNLAGTVTTDDYYEIAVVEYTERLHTDLAKATRLRGYVQIETPNLVPTAFGGLVGLKDAAGIGSEHIQAFYPDGITPIVDATGAQVYFVHKPHYLGPVILASKGKPVRMKFDNYLPYINASGQSVGSWNGTGAELAIPVDETIPGGGLTLDVNGVKTNIKMGQNRVSIHWHGGDTPWTGDGTPHQWFVPKGDISYTVGVDASHPHGMGKGESAANVPDMGDPGDGSYNLYFPNNLSGRLMFYHDHASGITRLNVYEGMAAGYVITDPVEQALVGTALGTTNALDKIGIPLVFQDKGFVPKNIGPKAVASDGVTPASQDAKWDLSHWGQPGDLFFPHVYETNQDPNSIDGTNPVGRWDWGPWFWPVFPAQYSLPTGAYGDVTTTPEAFMDTAVVNGQVYPTLTVDPKTYRFRILSVGNDRGLNLNLFKAVDANGVVCDANNKTPAIAPTAPGGTAPVACTEVKMVPALPTAGFPATWPTDGRVGGVPDPATAGPDIVQIGSEGGLLPAPAIWKSQPITYETNVRSITVYNIQDHGLLLAPAERADVLIDFTKYAGQTLIVYNDGPAPSPGYDPRIDYYSGMGDFTSAGGAYDVLPGYGPNTRTYLQIKVNTANTSGTGGALNVANLAASMPAAYAATQPAPIIPEAVYNAPFGTTSGNNYAAIGTGASTTPDFIYNVPPYVDANNITQTTKKVHVINKAIQELFDPLYGRMNATLAVELPFSNATIATTIPLAYVDEPIHGLDDINDWVSDSDTQIWKITHNGVDAHPVHFHLVNVQVINRVGWDGTIKPPQANEVGWKETLRMNPLEDVYVAVKAVHPVVPFGLPQSSRRLDPSLALNSQVGFTQIDPLTGQAPATPYSNKVLNFDNEYVWHCHILGHEEFDFMRPMIFHPTVVVPDAPGAVTVTGSTVSWSDPTPVGGQDAQGIPTAGTNAAYPEPTSSPKNEIGFNIYDSANTLLATVPANVTSWIDPAYITGNSYTVVAYNAAGDSVAGTSTTTASGGAITTTGTVTVPTSTQAPALAAAPGPTGLSLVLNSNYTVTASWTSVPSATGYIVALNGIAVSTVTTTTTIVGGLIPGNNTISVSADTPNGVTNVASGIVYNAVAAVPVALTASSGNLNNGNPPGSITVTWANNPLNLNNVTGLTLSWVYANGTSTTTNGSITFPPTVKGTTLINLLRDHDYNITLRANSNIGNSATVTTRGLSSP